MGKKKKAEAASVAVDETDAEIRARVLRKRAERDLAAAAGTPRGSEERLTATQSNLAAFIAERQAETVEVVETATGPAETATETVETAVEPVTFAKPSEAPKADFDVNGNGQYKVKRLSDGKVVGYPRVTTYISGLDDSSMLERWRSRIILEGVATGDSAETVATVNALIHNRDVAIEKARRRDRKGKLEPGELATYVDGAWRDFKRGMDALAAEAFEVGGGHEKAAKGTDLHALCAIAVTDGLDPIAEKLRAGEIGASDVTDVKAFLNALDRLGAEVVEVERPVVNDSIPVAGRLDYVVRVKLPGEVNRRRRVLDLKTGRIDLSPGKIAMQLALYASSTGYDLDTHEREDLKLDQKTAIVLHLPAGSGRATAHVVDLALARKGVALAGSVRAWRNEGKRTIDVKTNLLEAEQ